MNKLQTSICTVVLFLGIVAISPLAQAKDRLTLSLPESVLAEAIQATMPLDFQAASKSLQGNLKIINISELELLDQQLRCRLHLAGDQLQIVTKVAGHDIRLNVGSVELDFTTMATLRFDEKSQTLFVTPVVEKVSTSKDGSGGDIGKTIVQLFNGNEFPIDMENIEPIVTKAGAKTLIITTRIADIQSKNDWLQLFLVPQISTK